MNKKGALIGAVLLTISGCSALDLVDKVNPLKEEQGIEVTAQIGKENHQTNIKQLAEVDVNNSKDYTADQIGVIDNSINVPWWFVFLGMFVGILVRPIEFIKDLRGIK